MVRRTHIALLAALAATLVTAGPAAAQRGRDFGNSFDNSQEDRREVPLSSVLRDLRMQFGGRHLDAQKAGNRYIIAWITDDGRRMTIEVDAQSGRVISAR